MIFLTRAESKQYAVITVLNYLYIYRVAGLMGSPVLAHGHGIDGPLKSVVRELHISAPIGITAEHAVCVPCILVPCNKGYRNACMGFLIIGNL